MSNPYLSYYSIQAGSGFGIGIGTPFKGTRYQRGHSIFSSLARFIMPFARSMIPGLKRQALSTTAALASDLLAGQNLKTAAKARLKEAGRNLFEEAKTKVKKRMKGEDLNQTGSSGVPAIKFGKHSVSKRRQLRRVYKPSSLRRKTVVRRRKSKSKKSLIMWPATMSAVRPRKKVKRRRKKKVGTKNILKKIQFGSGRRKRRKTKRKSRKRVSSIKRVRKTKSRRRKGRRRAKRGKFSFLS